MSWLKEMDSDNWREMGPIKRSVEGAIWVRAIFIKNNYYYQLHLRRMHLKSEVEEYQAK